MNLRKAGTANRVPFLNTETTEERGSLLQRTISAPGTWSLHHCNSLHNHLWVDGLPNFLPSQKVYFISMCGQDWQNGVRTWRRVTWFFFCLRHCREGRWPGASDGGSLGWHKQALWWGYCGSSGVQAFRVCAEWNSVSGSSLVFTSLFNFSQVMDFFWAMDTSKQLTTSS